MLPFIGVAAVSEVSSLGMKEWMPPLTMNLSPNIIENAVTFIEKLQQHYDAHPETSEIQTHCMSLNPSGGS